MKFSILGHFGYKHLPADLQAISEPFHTLAMDLAQSLPPDSDETIVCFRKLLEAKDCAVRSYIETRGATQINKPVAAKPTKPYLGKIKDWEKLPCEGGLGYFIQGTFVDHPNFNGAKGTTSTVIIFDEITGRLETENNLYLLVPNEKN